jgi:superfamily II DNA or RNA helicase
MQLYDDQRKILNKLWVSLQNNQKVLFQSQTGAG